ncbi:oligopeptide transport system permease protein [Mycoplasma testudineum]|uniref:Oligopeptide transport system permease protein n=1 Tax=Mycoplasma testudineum TaxID=244584 RepID=A0A4R6IBY8_9MOLU|nr:ABC transporter permease [Mycoplasma testudineum]OYD26535.1 ABC transporter permease [Mycoplasma testudineum]TDO19126.1 oligopeptide transport system permease protein [Mycoplasma testudineum]
MILNEDKILFHSTKIEKVDDPLARIFNFQNRYWAAIFTALKILIEFVVISFIVVTIVFFLLGSVPGSTSLTSGLSESQAIAIKAKYGLDLPLGQRYLKYLGDLFQGNFGISLSIFPTVEISQFIWQRFGTSFSVGIISVFVTILIGIPLGILVGRKPGGLLDNASTLLISVLVSVPSIVFSLILLLIGRSIGIPYIFDQANFATYILPVLALSLGSIVIYVRYIRTELNRELNSMHAKFAYLKGVSRNRFVWMHALKPSLFPIATFFPGVILGSFIGSLFIEQIFSIPGSGGLFLNAIQGQDFSIVLFLTIVFVFLTILSYTSRDILYRLIDPRIRRGGH